MEKLYLLEHLEGVEGYTFYSFDFVEFPPPDLGNLTGYPFTKFILMSDEKD